MLASLSVNFPWYKPAVPGGLADHMVGVVHDALHQAYMTGLKDGILYACVGWMLVYFFFLRKD